MSDVNNIKECNCYPLQQPGMAIEVDSFNPLVCSRCKNIIRPKYLAENTPEKKLELNKLSDFIYNYKGNPYTGYSARLEYSDTLAREILAEFAIPETKKKLDKFCGITMDSKDVEEKLYSYGYSKIKKCNLVDLSRDEKVKLESIIYTAINEDLSAPMIVERICQTFGVPERRVPTGELSQKEFELLDEAMMGHMRSYERLQIIDKIEKLGFRIALVAKTEDLK